MRMIRKIVWLLLTAGLLVLSIQTASAIALGLAACLILLPLVLLPMNLRAAKKLKLTEKPRALGKPAERRGASG